MLRDDFQFLAGLLKRACGIILTAERAELTKGRLQRIAERHGLPDVSSLIKGLRSGEGRLVSAVVEALTIHDTCFFRDRAAFDNLRDVVLPCLEAARKAQRRLSLWSAACGTGQEAYSLAMLLDGMPQFAGWQIEILATDVSADAIAHARAGLYSQAEMQRGLPGSMLGHFQRSGSAWRVGSAIQNHVRFEVANLLDSVAGRGPFDVILCRNVLMYFDAATKADIIERLSHVLAGDGYVLLGSAETLLGTSSRLSGQGFVRGVTKKTDTPIYASPPVI
jgi:chemotaxis protein methyltransferase CheR